MKFLSILVLAAASTALAKDHKENANSTKAECKKVERMTKLVDLANNSTKLDKVTKGNATRASEIQTEASSAAASLQTLTANATLMTACDQEFAVQAMDHACEKMVSMEKLMKITANQTLLDERTKNNATKAAALQAKASAEAPALSSMQANATLTSFCAGFNDKAQCKEMSRLQKDVDLSKNTTALNDHFKNNATKIAEFQAKASKMATKLATMQGNSTLSNTCAALKKSSSNSAADASGSGGISSAASSIPAVGAMASLLAVFMAGLMVL